MGFGKGLRLAQGYGETGTWSHMPHHKISAPSVGHQKNSLQTLILPRRRRTASLQSEVKTRPNVENSIRPCSNCRQNHVTTQIEIPRGATGNMLQREVQRTRT
eukprot:5894680-Amphidinium_carterae.1